MALHLAIGALFANFKAPRGDQEEFQRISMMRKVAVVIRTPPPTPAPTPPPKREVAPVKPQAATQPKALKLNVVHIPSTSNGPAERTYVAPAAGSENGAPGGSATGTGNAQTAETPSPKPACEDPHVQASLAKMGEIDYPESQRELGITGVVDVEVTLTATGAVAGVSIYRSSGHPPLDQAALRVAQSSTYAPEEVDCKDVPGSYLMHVTFGST